MIKINVTGIDATIKDMRLKLDAQARGKTASVKRELISELKAATPVDTGRARDNWQITQQGLSNDTEYIDELNAGSSQQAPPYFIEKTVLANPNVVPNGTIVTHR